MNDAASGHSATPFLTWWRAYVRPVTDTAAARALRARLRRADSVLDVLAEPDVHRLVESIPRLRDTPDILADIVCTLALVERYDARRLALLLGPGKTDPALSASRFEKLMGAGCGELRAVLRRALPMADFRCNVEALAQDILAWDDEKTRVRWWFAYYRETAPTTLPTDQMKEPAA